MMSLRYYIHKSANEIPEKKTFVQHNEREEEGPASFSHVVASRKPFCLITGCNSSSITESFARQLYTFE